MSEANQIRINELARELEVKAKAIIDYLPEAGVTEKKICPRPGSPRRRLTRARLSSMPQKRFANTSMKWRTLKLRLNARLSPPRKLRRKLPLRRRGRVRLRPWQRNHRLRRLPPVLESRPQGNPFPLGLRPPRNLL